MRLGLAPPSREAVDGKVEMADSEGEDQTDDRLAVGNAGTTTMSQGIGRGQIGIQRYLRCNTRGAAQATVGVMVMVRVVV